MAAKDFDSDDIKKQELDDITTCCICTGVYTHPKALPCIHTFCLKCIQSTGLKTNKGPGDKLPCPICRRLFKIPPEGFHGLPKNLFIERLLQVANASDSSTASRVVCDACLEDENEEMGREIPSAAKFCFDCKRKLCEECCSEHSKFKLTKKHKLVAMTENEDFQNMIDLRPSVCEQHEQKVLDVYCTDCKTVVCAICFIDDHKNHDGSHINKFVTGFRTQIESRVEAMNECRSTAEMKRTELLKLKEDIQERVESLESAVKKRKDELKQLIEKHATSLLQDLCSIKQSRQKEIQLETDDIDAYLSSLETYNSYCQNIMTKGSASDICCAFSDLSSRALELQRQCQLTNEIEIKSFSFSFRKSEVEQLLTESCGNLIAQIEEEGEPMQKKRGQQIIVEQSIETDILSLRSANEQLRIDINNEIEANKAHKMTIKTLIDSVEELEEELSRNNQDQLRYISDPVLIQTIRTDAAEVKQKAIWGLTILDKELFVVTERSSEVEVYNSSTLSFSRRWNLMELIDPIDLRSCERNKCLYIMDYKRIRQSKEILRVDPKGKLIQKWSIGDIWGRLSVAADTNVILAVHGKYTLNEYSPNGELMHQVNLSSGGSFCYPMHAIKLINGHFVITFNCFDDDDDDDDDDDYDYDDDDADDDRQRVCIVDADGRLKKSFGGERGSSIGQLNDPVHLSVDGNGFIMVADRWNSRVMLLDSGLKFKREILSKEKHGLRQPSRILLDELNSRLFVVDNKWSSEKVPFVDGRILIYDF